MARIILKDLNTLIETTPSPTRIEQHSRVHIVRTLFQLLVHGILEVTIVSETNAVTKQQLREKLFSIRELLQQQETRKRTRKDIEDEQSEDEQSEDEQSEDEQSKDRQTRDEQTGDGQSGDGQSKTEERAPTECRPRRSLSARKTTQSRARKA
ncbi:hypothetical protein FP744_10003204 [Trichoderma asperellum]|nr:hypothetical protein LI328DRAFT_169047 [Trichoderma asperelloides]